MSSEPRMLGAPRPSRRELTLRDHWLVLRARRRTILASVLAALALAFLLNRYQRPRYEAQASLLLNRESGDNPTDSMDAVLPSLGPATLQRDIHTQVRVMQARPFLAAAAKRAGLPATRALPVQVDAGKEDNIITVTATSPDPAAAKALANSVANLFVERSLEQNRRSAHAGRVFLEGQQRKYEQDLRDASRRLRDYEARTGAVGIDAATDSRVRALTQAETDLRAATTDRIAATERLARLRDAYKGTTPTVVASSQITRNPEVDQLQKQIAQLVVQRAALLEDYQPGTDKVLAVEAQIQKARDRIRQLARDVLASREVAVNPVHQALFGQVVDAEGQAIEAGAREAGLSRVVAEHQAVLRQLPDQQYRLSQLQRDVQSAEKTYLAVQDRYQMLRIAEESTLPNAEVIEPAALPTSPVNPHGARLLILALVAGLAVGVALVTVREAVDDRVWTVQDVESHLALPILGAVARIREPGMRRLDRAGNASAIAEAFRRIRASIRFLTPDAPVHSLVVTSTGPGEGKTFTAVNLALSMAQAGSRVLLVDGDLRRPSVHTALGLANEAGLTDILVGGASVETVAHAVAAGDLRAVTAGPIPPNPAELLESPRFAQVVEDLLAQCDVLVLDAPPVLGVVDTTLIAGRVDAVVLTLAAGAVERRTAQRAIQLLQQARTRLLGVVLNKVDERRADYCDMGTYLYKPYGNGLAGHLGGPDSGNPVNGGPANGGSAGIRRLAPRSQDPEKE